MVVTVLALTGPAMSRIAEPVWAGMRAKEPALRLDSIRHITSRALDFERQPSQLTEETVRPGDSAPRLPVSPSPRLPRPSTSGRAILETVETIEQQPC